MVNHYKPSKLGHVVTQKLERANQIRKLIDEHVRQVSILETQLAQLMGVRAPRGSSGGRRSSGRAQPTLREFITQIITEAGRPLRIPDIVDEMRKRHYHMKSSSPEKALSVKLYTDKAFKIAKPGHFTVAR